jgi:hypothetical protein
MENYRIYAKLPGQSKFSAMDWGKGVQVSNLIYATLIPEQNLERAKTALINLTKDYAGIKLELRDTKNKVIFKAY